MTTRQDIITEAERLVATLKARGETHGQGDANFIVMAMLLNTCGYRRNVQKPGTIGGVSENLDAVDACIIYEVSKLARVVCGDRLEPDHYLDTAGYGIIAAAIVKGMREPGRIVKVTDYNAPYAPPSAAGTADPPPRVGIVGNHLDDLIRTGTFPNRDNY